VAQYLLQQLNGGKFGGKLNVGRRLYELGIANVDVKKS
jgi:hypothetical protein